MLSFLRRTGNASSLPPAFDYRGANSGCLEVERVTPCLATRLFHGLDCQNIFRNTLLSVLHRFRNKNFAFRYAYYTTNKYNATITVDKCRKISEPTCSPVQIHKQKTPRKGRSRMLCLHVAGELCKYVVSGDCGYNHYYPPKPRKYDRPEDNPLYCVVP